jgi:hypothetical protein
MLPRDYLQNPDEFGHNLAARWRVDLPENEAPELVVAGMQHRASAAVRRALGGRPTSLLAERVGTDDSTLGRKLNGKLSVSLIDLSKWAMLLTPGALEAIPHDPHDLLPPSHRPETWEPGHLELPRLTTPSIGSLNWNGLVDDLRIWFALETSLGSAPGITREVVCHQISRHLCEIGITAEQQHFNEVSSDAGRLALSLGIGPILSIETGVLYPATAPTDITRQRIAAALAALARLATAPTGDRFIVIVGAPSTLTEMGFNVAEVTVGSSSAESLGLSDPLTQYWESPMNLRASSAGADFVVNAYEVGKGQC